MAGPPMAIDIKQGTRPIRRLTAHTIPQTMKKEADAQIRKMLKNKVITSVDHTMDWVSPGFFVEKPNGGVRLVTELNTHINRPVYPFRAPEIYYKMCRTQQKCSPSWTQCRATFR